MGKSKEGICRLCSQYKKLSFEHVPPESAFNNAPILIKKHEHLFDKQSHVFGKSIRSNRGSGGHYFCLDCNNKTGGWYVNEFTSFVKQVNTFFVQKSTKDDLNFISVEFKPLPVLKQILTMFLAIENSGVLRSDKELVHFLLDKENQDLPEKYQVYIYTTNSIKKRLHGIQYHYRDGIYGTFSEITFNPLGYFLCVDSEPPLPRESLRVVAITLLLKQLNKKYLFPTHFKLYTLFFCIFKTLYAFNICLEIINFIIQMDCILSVLL